MSFSTFARSLPRRFGMVLTSFLQRPGLAFADALPEDRIQAAFVAENVDFAQQDDEIYTPALTLWAFLSQVLFKEEQRSCSAAVARVAMLRRASGQEPPSGNTGAYCRARAKLPVPVLRRLTTELADGCERQIPSAWLWQGHPVKLADGTTCSMPDTAANQAHYPQSTAQQPGLGFPIVRLVLLLSLATGMLCDMAAGPYAGKETGETALLRELLSRLDPNDVLLADRFYCSYFMICLLMAADVQVVTRLHQRRTADFRRGTRVGAGDHVVQWRRPPKPAWMDEATYALMPTSIRVREVEVCVPQPGFRTRLLVVVTTLLDADRYTRYDLAELYHQRWLAELDIRAIKVTLGMDVLRSKSPEMVHREIWSCLLAYNLLRQTLLASAQQAALSPRQLSLTAALQKVAAGLITVLVMDAAVLAQWIEDQQRDLALARIGDRPNRVEPRALKRRPKPHKLLKTPRPQARAELLTRKV